MCFPRITSVRAAVAFKFFLLLAVPAFSQQADPTQSVLQFNGAVSLTINGFSLIPAFSLGKPAAIATLYAGGKRLSLYGRL